MKTDGTVRVCGDYKLTVNKVSKLDGYPIPKLDDLYTKLAGGQMFTELDLSHAYEQMLVDENSREFLTINTHVRAISEHTTKVRSVFRNSEIKRLNIPQINQQPIQYKIQNSGFIACATNIYA